MANVPLNKVRRSQIVENLRKTFTRRIDELNAKLNDASIGEEIYDFTYSQQQQKLMAELQSISAVRGGRTMVRTMEMITAEFPKEIFQSLPHNRTIAFPLVPKRTVGYTSSGWGGDPITTRIDDPTLPVAVRVMVILDAVTAVEKERDDLADTIAATLNQCSTLRQAEEVWPSVMNFITDEMRTQRNKPVKARLKAVKEEFSLDEDTKVALIKASLLK